MVSLAFLASRESETAEKTIQLTVDAGAFARRGTVVAFELPRELKGDLYGLRDKSGGMIPLQVNVTRATFVLPELAAGAKKSYEIVQLKGRPVAGQGVQLARVKNRLDVELAGRKVLSFVTGPHDLPNSDIKPIFLRGGYIHPVYTPSGRTVTDDYPSDHYHHHGIWFAWTKTEFEGGHPDFWNMGDGTGRVEFEALEDTWSGPVHAGFRSRQRYVALTGAGPKTALSEQWDVRIYSVGKSPKPYFVFDIAVTQQCATGSPLILEEYRYGGVAVRGHRDWKDKSKVAFLTSEGKTRENGNATRGRWCHIGGPVEGQLVGIAVLDHPANFRAPAPLRIHPDDPYFNYAPSQAGKFEIRPGEKFILRYRYIVADGRPDPDELNRLWNDYANPPEVTITVK
jgi:hypothetical protein